MARSRYRSYGRRTRFSRVQSNWSGLILVFVAIGVFIYAYWKALFVNFLIIATGVYIFNRLYKAEEHRQWRQSGINEIDQMSGVDFERRLQHHFQDVEWIVKMTPVSGDFGADLIGKDDKGARVVVQAKRYNGKVGIDAVQQVLGAREHYKASRMLLITNSHLTSNAKQLAKSARVEVWEREDLIRELASNNGKAVEVTSELT